MPEDTPNPIVAEAKEGFQVCVDSEATERARQLDDLNFFNDEQWSEKAKNERARDGRPALVVNRLGQFVQHITNSMRQNRVSAKVFPVDDQADPDTAEVIQGLLRHIEYTSKADIAYDWAAFYAVAMGMGYFRIITEWCDPMSWDQDLKIEMIPNPFQVYLGGHHMPDGSDAKQGFVFTDLTKAEYKANHPESELAQMEDWTAAGAQPPNWLEKDGCRIVEYYKIENSPDELIRFADGTTVLASQIKGDLDESKIAVNPRTGKQVRRKTSIPIVHWYKLNAVEVLEQTVWPGEYIPIIKVTGNELNVDGKKTLKGIVRSMKDAQRQYNFMLSAQTEAIDMDKGQVVYVEGQFEGKEGQLKKLSSQKTLEVKKVDIKGNPAPMPTRLAANASIAAMTQAREMAGDDLKSLTSIYDAALGNQSNETSGRAIGARQQQSDTANFHYQDNLTRAITQGAKVMLAAIPVYYNEERVVRIIGEDDTHKIVKVNQQLQEGAEGKAYSLGVGKYDVICTASQSFATKRQESAEKITELIRVAPGLMNIVPDYVVKAQDIPYANEMAERIKKTLPPQLQDQEDGQPDIPPQAQQAIAQLTQQNEELTKHLEMATEEYQTEKQKADHNIALEEKKFANAKELALIDRETQLLKIEATIDAQAAKATMEAEIQQIHAELDAIRGQQTAEHAAGLDSDSAQQQSELQMQQAEHGAGLQMAQAEHGSGLAMEQAEHAQSIAPEPTASEGAE